MKHVLRIAAGVALAAGLAASAAAADLKVGLRHGALGPDLVDRHALQQGHAGGARLQAGGRRPQGAADRARRRAPIRPPPGATRSKLIEEDKVDILIGSAGVPSSMAIAAVARESKVPMIALTPIGLAGPEGAWVVAIPQPTDLMVNAVIDADEEGRRQDGRLHRLFRRLGRPRLQRADQGHRKAPASRS